MLRNQLSILCGGVVPHFDTYDVFCTRKDAKEESWKLVSARKNQVTEFLQSPL